MDRSTSEQSFSDQSTDGGCSQPSTAGISDETQLSFGDLYLQQSDELSKFYKKIFI